MSTQKISDMIAKKRSDETSELCSDQFIFRIDNILRKTCEAAYEPEMVSIGPYHRGKKNLRKMEKYKWQYLAGILERKGESSEAIYIDTLIKHEKKARGYYAGKIKMNQEDFVEMMLLDGCFIVEFFRKYGKKVQCHDDDDPIFKTEWILEILCRDLLLFENQIPFFILLELFDMTKNEVDEEEDLVFLAVSCLNGWKIVGDTINHTEFVSNIEVKNVIHLLCLMSVSWCYSLIINAEKDQNDSNSDRKKRPKFSCITIGKLNCCNNYLKQQPEKPDGSNSDRKKRPKFSCITLGKLSCCNNYQQPEKPEEPDGSNSDRKKRPEFSCITLGKLSCCDKYVKQQPQNPEEPEEDSNDIMFIKSVSELKQDGIKFAPWKQSKSLFNIKFENGEIKIPPLVIKDSTESIFRNLIAYEHYMFDSGYSGKYVTDYMVLMDCLINTPRDVQNLRVEGIVKNWLGNDKEVSTMINNICKNIFVSLPDFTYRQLFEEVNEHCNRRPNPWITDLMNTYFKNPWSIMSVSAATLLLVLTLLQTVISILQYLDKDVCH